MEDCKPLHLKVKKHQRLLETKQMLENQQIHSVIRCPNWKHFVNHYPNKHKKGVLIAVNKN